MNKLYGSDTSPYVRHCRIALGQTDLEWQFIEIDHEESFKRFSTKRVPYLEGEDLNLHDSLSILYFARAHKGRPLFGSALEANQYTLASTVIESMVSFILLDSSKVNYSQSHYDARQSGRIQDTMQLLESFEYPATINDKNINDGLIRIGCLMVWGEYRERLAVADYPNLAKLVDALNQWTPFANTSPPVKE